MSPFHAGMSLLSACQLSTCGTMTVPHQDIGQTEHVWHESNRLNGIVVVSP